MSEIHHGETLRQVLLEQGRTMKWLAEHLKGVEGRKGVSTQSVSGMMKSRRIREDRIKEINQLLGIDLEMLAVRASKLHPGASILKMTVVKDDEVEQTPRTQEFLDRLEELLKAFEKLSPEEKSKFLGSNK